jgi:hypothetical protein
MIFAVGLKVLGQMLDPAREKCDLHIRAAGIFFVQLKLLQTQRWVAFCHGEALILDQQRVFATRQRGRALPQPPKRGTPNIASASGRACHSVRAVSAYRSGGQRTARPTSARLRSFHC